MNDELKNIFQFTCIKSFIPRPYAEQFKRKFQHNLLITGLSAPQQSLTTYNCLIIFKSNNSNWASVNNKGVISKSRLSL